ncbi:MAG: site-2 protease family protein [Candidatus Eremiobacteraeota bacterium]|nr:site-2 protease family protein [Candidatus Eremiobacteraeota bacterium]MBV8499242.1 site-2 protease family protein [Candidatus Eremiobacteraeota bacterium]
MSLLAVITLIGFEKVLTFLVMLSVLIVLHELGHFVLARRNGVRINEFAVGFGPKLASWTSQRSGTMYSLRILPIGGFCAMEGEDNRVSEAEQQREFRTQGTVSQSNFQAKSPWRRLGIILAGPFANFLLCYLILLTAALAFGVASDKAQPVVGMVSQGSPAAIAGIAPGDRIIAIDNVPITNGKSLVDTIHNALGKRLDLVYERNGIRTEVYIVPRRCPPQVGRKLGCIGFSPVPAYERVGVLQAVRESANGFVTIANETFGGLGLLVTQFSKYAPQIAGPIGMGEVAATVQDWGWGPYFSLAATISFALGLFNLLPIPALDGGRAAFIIAELIRGRPVDPEKEAMVHIAGFAALMALIMLVAFHDIARIINGQGVM